MMGVHTKIRSVCVIFGGVSTEHIISLRSAYNIICALRKSSVNIIRIGITPDGQWRLFEGADAAILDGTWDNTPSARISFSAGSFSPRDFLMKIAGSVPDVIFPAVHGINCEDGTLQGLLELTGIPYVGCNVLASSAGMDKLHSKKIFKIAGIPQCKYIPVTRNDINEKIDVIAAKVLNQLGYPCFIKPSNGGSSVGTIRVNNPESLQDALREASKYDFTILVEEFIEAREIEAAVMGNDKPLIAKLGEILTSDKVEYYDYQTKYFDSESSSVRIPADISREQENKIKRYAKKAYLALGCSGLSRVDFFMDKRDGRIMINEINTLPGFTPISLFPKAWDASGLPVDKLVLKLCEYAIDYKDSRRRQEII